MALQHRPHLRFEDRGEEGCLSSNQSYGAGYILFACGRVQMTMARHACAARDEAQQLADEFCALTSLTTVATPAIHQLYAYLDPIIPPLPEGSTEILLAEPAHMESLRLM